MTTGPSNPNPRPGPHGLPPLDPQLEADLLAWIEGEPLPRARDAAVARALDADPALAARLLAMRSDRNVLRSMADEPAPAGLLEAALAALEPAMERRMLLELAEGKPLHDHPPVSIVRPPRQTLWQTFMSDRLGRRLSLAAALLLVVGATAYFAASSLEPRPNLGDPNGTRIAQADPEPDAGVTSKTAPERTIAMAPEAGQGPAPQGIAADRAAESRADYELTEPRVLAEAPTPGPTAEKPVEVAGVPTEVAVAEVLRELEEATAAEAGMTADRALALAREGRLAIRVVSTHPSLAIHQLDRRLGRRAGGGSWRLAGDVPAPIVAAVANPGPPVVLASAAARQGEPMFFTSAREPVRVSLPTPTSPPVTPALVPQPEIAPESRMAEVRLDAEVLEAVRGAIGRAAGGDAVFEELPTPVPDEALPVSPAAVFWWTRPASEWTAWARVPVVVEAP